MKPGEIAHHVSRGAFWLTLEKSAALFSGIAYFALLSRWLGPTKYGIMTLALSFTGLAVTATGNPELYLERYAAEFEAHGLVRTLRRAHLAALAVKLALGVLAAVVLASLAPWLAFHFQMPELTALLPVLAFTVALDGLSTTGRATLYGIQQFRWLSALAIAFHLAKVALVAGLWASRQGLFALAVGLSALTVAQGAAQTLVPLWAMRRAEDREPTTPERTWSGLLRGMVAYCTPLLGARVAFLSGQNLSKIVLGKLFDATQLGYFAFAFQTLERFVELAYGVPAALQPSFTRLVARREWGRLRSVFDQSQRLVQVIACALSFGIFAFAREYTLLIGSPLFAPAIPLLRVLALVPLARTAQQPLTMLFQALRRPGTVFGLAVLKFVTEFGCYFLLVRRIGVMGAAWANLAGAAASFAVAMVLLARVLPEGAALRARATVTAIAGVAPFLIASAAIEAAAPPAASLALRLALLPAAVFVVFALGLVNRYDLDKLSAVPLRVTWMRRVRDSLVGAAGHFARAVEPRRSS